MTIEELLKPRYKVSEEGYPDMLFDRQEIITLDQVDSSTNQYYTETKNGDCYYDKYFDMFPSIFRRLPWYADRKPEDMPEYVKIKDKIFKVEKWEYDGDTEVENELYAVLDKYYKGAKDWYPRTFDMKPATLEEYESFINSSDKKYL